MRHSKRIAGAVAGGQLSRGQRAEIQFTTT